MVLRPVGTDHLPDVWALLADPEVARLTGSVHTSSPTAQEIRPWSLPELTGIYQQWMTSDDRIVWVIQDRTTGAIVGESVLNDLDRANSSCGFRIWIAGATGRGLGTEAVRLTVGHAFGEQQLHRVELDVYDFNPRARRVYEKVGFRLEGTRREALRFDDGWVDAHQMAMLRSDWEPAGPVAG